MTDAARAPNLEPEERRTIPVAVWVSVVITLLAIVLGRSSSTRPATARSTSSTSAASTCSSSC
jgi:hypothetical protein